MKRFILLILASVALVISVTGSSSAAGNISPSFVIVDGGGCFHGYCCNWANHNRIITIAYGFPYGTVRYQCRMPEGAWVSL